MLDLSGMPSESIKSLSIKVGTDAEGKKITMRTHVINPANFNNNKKPKMVFLHGYAAAGCIYYGLYPVLSEHFCAIFVDTIGMGSSSRPNDFDKANFTPEQTITYFTDYLEKWRVGFSKVIGEEFTQFLLLGHSFSGYVAGHYTLRNP